MGYDAFVSYSHAADSRLAPALQRGLQRLAKPWFRLRALRVFLDESALSANPQLWTSIRTALDASDWFVLLASPEAVRSEWVNRELEHWLSHKSAYRILPIVTDGTWAWTSDGLSGSAVSPALHDAFGEEPRHVDLRWTHDAEELDLRNGRFRDAVAQVAAPIHGTAKDDLESEDLRVQRRARRLARGAVGLLSLLLTVAVVTAAYAFIQRSRANRAKNAAQHQATVADSGRLAAQASALVDGHLDLALLLAVEARQLDDSVVSRGALEATLIHAAPLVRLVQFGPATTSAAVSPDGRLVALGASDGTIAVRALATGRLVTTYPRHARAVTGVLAFSPDDKTLAVSRADGSVDLRDVATGRTHRSRLVGRGSELAALAFSPDGRSLAGTDLRDITAVWDLSSRSSVASELPVPKGFEGPPETPAWSGDSRTLALGSIGNVTVWNARSRHEVGPAIYTAVKQPSGLAVSPDGRTIAVGTSNDDVSLFDAVTGQPTGLPLTGLTQPIAWLTFKPDGTALAASDNAGTVAVWDLATRALRDRPLIGLTAASQAGILTADNQLVTLGLHAAAIWRLRAPYQPLGHVIWGSCSLCGDVSSNATTVLLVAGTGGKFVLWDPRDRRGTQHTFRGDPLFDAALSPTGAVLAAATASGRVLIVKSETGATMGAVGSYTSVPRALAFSPDGRRILVGGDDGTALEYDLRTLREVGPPLTPNAGPIWGVGISPDGRVLATSSYGGAVTLYDSATHRVLHTLETHQVLNRLSFSPDGRTLAVASLAGAILIRVATGTQVGEPLVGHTARFFDVAFSHDGRTLVTTSEDGTLILYDLTTRQPIGDPLIDGNGVPYAATFTPDDRTLLASDSSATPGQVVAWDIDPNSWQREACAIAGRNLTHDEWRQYLGDRPYNKTCAQWPAGQ
jgi:WD40 repeat protein